MPKKLEGLEKAIGNSLIDLLTTPGGAAWWAECKLHGRFMSATYQVTDKFLAAGRRPTATEVF
ncbi:MAG: hypothetical protein AAFR35_00735 [Pseudomonadota bacterium]